MTEPDPEEQHIESATGEQENFVVRMEAQCSRIDEYREAVKRTEGRHLSEDDAALEWIARYAKDFPFSRK
ncbi:MAG: hypothetical protein V7700_09125 [Halioglobus sp.]